MAGTEVYLTKLVDVTADPSTSAKDLAHMMFTTMEKLCSHNPNGEEALAIVRNKFLRADFAAKLAPSRNSTKGASNGNGHTKPAIRRMSEETKAKLSKSATKRWKKIKKERAEAAASQTSN